jgi:alpha-glucosidase
MVKQPSQAWRDGVQHDGSGDYVSDLCPDVGQSVEVRLRMGRDAPVQRVILRFLQDGEPVFVEMQRSEVGEWAFWAGLLPIREPRTLYRFLLLAEDGHYFYNTQGLDEHDPLDIFDFKILGGYQAPDWVKTSVFYQINPDTWRNERPEINPKTGDFDYFGHKLTFKKWGEALERGQPYWLSFYGGDLYGVAASLNYLEELGVNALYLNPIFKAFSTHRYDTADYELVDPFLGGNQALEALSAALHQRGFRYILDIVPNHCGRQHAWFIKAQHDPLSTERDFFTFTHYPDQYHCWCGAKALVKLNYASPELRERMYAGQESIFRRWLRPPYGVDGWRVDVGNMLGRDGLVQMNHSVLRGIRQAVKQENGEVYLMGEHFLDASDQLQGDMWDGVMNYSGFYMPLLDWLAGFERNAIGFPEIVRGPGRLSTPALVRTWKERLGAAPWILNLQQFNMLGSHDTRRITSVLYDKPALYWLAVGLQMTFPGAPCVYYGNEIGMRNPEGEFAASAGARTCMEWDTARWDMASLQRYKTLIHLRRSHPALSEGGFQVLQTGEHGFIYQRKFGQDGVIFSANRSAQAWRPEEIDACSAGWGDGAVFEEFGGQRRVSVQAGRLQFPALEQGGRIWVKK